MKNILFLFSLVAMVSAGASDANASVSNSASNSVSKLTCVFEDPAIGAMIFRAPPGVDLLNPPAGGPFEPTEIDLYRGDDTAPTRFQVRKTQTRNEVIVDYTYRHPVWISDVHIQVVVNAYGQAKVSGTLRVDHPPVYKFSCQ